MVFTDYLIDETDMLWQEMLDHPFLESLKDGDLGDGQFNKWLRQDYEFVRAALPFVSSIKPKAPDEHLRSLSEAEMALHEELDLFEERAKALGVNLENVDRNLTTQSYIQHLMSTGYRKSYPVALTVYWAAEKAYHESWKQVEPSLSQDHRWYPFVQNWAGDDFAEFVDFLGNSLNEIADDVTGTQEERMIEQFQWTVRYEIAFWDMANGRSGEQWIRTYD